MELKIDDEDGFLSIVNTDRYQTFVHEDWTMESLMCHFTDQMNELNCIVWRTDDKGGDLWTVRILEEPSTEKSFREASHEIEVADGKLYVVDYTDLTMAAQFDDEVLPRSDHADQYIELENGVYSITIRQLFDPYGEGRHADARDLVFEIIPRKSSRRNGHRVESILWWDDRKR